MPLAPSQRYKLYQPIVATDRFEIPFPIFGVDDLTVFIDRVEEPLFSVEATFQNSRADGAVIVLTAPVFDVDVEIYGTRTPRRDSNYLNNDPNLAQRLQSDQDMLTAVQQEQAREYLRTLRVGTNDPFVGPLEGTEADRAGKAMIFSSDGKSLEVGPTADQIANAESYAERAEFAAETIEDAVTINGVGRASGDGVTTVFTLPIAIASKNNVDVIINGVQQFKTAYDVSVDQITFVSAPPAGSNNIEFNCKGNFSGVVDTLPQGLTTPTLVAAAASSIPDVVQQMLLSGWSDIGDTGIAALFIRVGSEPSHTAKFQSQDGSWWERVIDEHGVVVPWYGPCDSQANRRQTVLDAYAHWSSLNATAYGATAPAYDACKLYFPNIPGLDVFDVGATVDIVTVGSHNHLQGPGPSMAVRGIRWTIEDRTVSWHGFHLNGDVEENGDPDDYLDAIILGTANGRADRCRIFDFSMHRPGNAFRIEDVAGSLIFDGTVREARKGIRMRSYNNAVNPDASGDCMINNVFFSVADTYNVDIRGYGELKFNGCTFFDSKKPNLFIQGSGTERVLQMYFTDCTFTIGHDDQDDDLRSSTAITSITDNGSGDVRVNFASGQMPYIFEGMRRMEFEFASVYTQGDLPPDHHITNVTDTSFDIPGMAYAGNATGTVYHPGWNIYIDNSSVDDSGNLTTDTYDLHFINTKVNSAYIGKSDNVNWIGSMPAQQIFVDAECRAFTRQGSSLARYGEVNVDNSSLPISGSGKWTDITNFRSGDEFGSVFQTPHEDAEYDTPGKFNLPSLISGVKSTNKGVTVFGPKLAIDTPEVRMANVHRFSAYLSGTQSNVTGNGTVATVAFDTETEDVGGVFASGVFTGQIAGVYRLETDVQLQQIGTATEVRLQLVTSAGTFDARETAASIDATRMTLRISKEVYLAVGQTAYVTARVTGLGADTADIVGGNAPFVTTFTGRLVG